MSFKNDYKSAFGSVSSDTDEIISGVHEMLSENTPLKLRVQQKKKPVWAIVGSVAGAAACVALAVTVAVKVVPNLIAGDEMFGVAGEPEQGAVNNTNIDNEANIFDGTAENEGLAGTGSGYKGEYAEDIVLEVNDDNILDAEDVYINGYRYVRANVFTMYDIPEGLLPVKSVDGRVFYVYGGFEDDVILIADEHWRQNNRVWGFVFDRDRYGDIKPDLILTIIDKCY